MGAMETPQHGNGPKSDFLCFFLFKELSEIPQQFSVLYPFPLCLIYI